MISAGSDQQLIMIFLKTFRDLCDIISEESYKKA